MPERVQTVLDGCFGVIGKPSVVTRKEKKKGTPAQTYRVLKFSVEVFQDEEGEPDLYALLKRLGTLAETGLRLRLAAAPLAEGGAPGQMSLLEQVAQQMRATKCFHCGVVFSQPMGNGEPCPECKSSVSVSAGA